MSEFVTGVFVGTTADDQRSYFTGEVQLRTPPFVGKGAPVAPGVYRVIDGKLCRIVSGLENVRARLLSATRE
jgi:hypothetical protein